MASVNAFRGRLYLLARLPARNGAQGLKQQRISLRLDDTPVKPKEQTGAGAEAATTAAEATDP